MVLFGREGGLISPVRWQFVNGIYNKKRISKIFIPYVIWSLIFTVVYGSYSSLLNNLITANANLTFYYVFVYIQLVLLTPLIGKLLKSKYSWFGWCITPISIIIIRYVCTLMRVELGFPFPGTLFVVWFTYYYLGMGLGNHILKYNLNWKKSIVLYGLVLVLSEVEGLAWMLYGNYDMATTQIRFTSLLTSTVACLLVYKFIKDDGIVIKDNMVNKMLIKIGDCSFGIYLSHVLVMVVLAKIPGYGYLFFPVRSLIIIGLTTLCVMAGGKILGKFRKYVGL